MTFNYDLLEAAVRDDVRQAAQIIRAQTENVQGVLTIGKQLLAVQDKLGQHWNAWLAAEFNTQNRTAEYAMDQANNYGSVNTDIADEAVQNSIMAGTRKLFKHGRPMPAMPRHQRVTKRKQKKAVQEPPRAKLSKLDRIARAYQLPLGTFAQRKDSPDAKQITVYMREAVHEQASRNAEASGSSLTEAVAEAIATYAAPAPERKPVVMRDLGKMSEFGEGAGIDADGEFRHVRRPNVEARREEWLGQHFGELVTAMRDFIAKVPASVDVEHANKWLSHNPKETHARQVKLRKAKAAFVPLAQRVLKMLEEVTS